MQSHFRRLFQCLLAKAVTLTASEKITDSSRRQDDAAADTSRDYFYAVRLAEYRHLPRRLMRAA